jgi:precorrin-6B methylase 1
MNSQNVSNPDKDPLFEIRTAVLEYGFEIIRDASKTQLALAQAARLAQEIEIATLAEQKAHEAEIAAASNYIELLLGELATSDPAYQAACERLGVRFDGDESIIVNTDHEIKEILHIRTESMQFNDGSAMPTRITNALRREGCYEVRDVVMLGMMGFLDIRNIGDQAVQQLQKWMEENGFADQWKKSRGNAEQAAEFYDSLDNVVIAVTSIAEHVHRISRSQFHVIY